MLNQGCRRKSKMLGFQDKTETVWILNDVEADEYLNQEMIKFAVTKGKLNTRGRKLALKKEEFNQIFGFSQ